MHKKAVFHLINNTLDWILVVLVSLLLTSCSMNTAVNTKPWGQNPKEAPNVIPITSNSVWSVVFSPDSKTLIA